MNTLPPATYIETDAHLRELAAHLAAQPLIAVDTESNSLHAYRERVCLIQISTRDDDYIVDPLTIGDLSPLAPLFANPRIEKVFHAAEYDIMCLKRDFGFKFNNLFDTMIAARSCSLKQFGLGALLAQFIGVEADKSHQRDDWGQRPLPESSLAYAQMDTHYLPELRDHLADLLERVQCMEEAAESFAELCHLRPAAQVFDPDGYWRLAFTHRLAAREVAVLRELYLWRESVAEERDHPPFKVMGDKALIALAIDQPTSQHDLPRIEGVGHGNARRYGRDLLRLIEQGRRATPPAPPPPDPVVDPLTLDLFSALREWRKGRATQREVESDVIISRDALWAIAVQMPTTHDALAQIPSLGAYRLDKYSAELLDVVGKFANRRG